MDGRDLPTGQTGRLMVRGAQMFSGYHKRPDIATFDAEGWFDTGDLAYLDAEGYIPHQRPHEGRAHPRRRNWWRSNLLAKRPGAGRRGVVGFPDARLGERGCVYVVKAKPERTFDLPALQAYAGQILSRQNVLARRGGGRGRAPRAQHKIRSSCCAEAKGLREHAETRRARLWRPCLCRHRRGARHRLEHRAPAGRKASPRRRLGRERAPPGPGGGRIARAGLDVGLRLRRGLAQRGRHGRWAPMQSHFGAPVRVLVNNAVWAKFQPLAQIDDRSPTAFAVGLKAMMWTLQAVLPQMRKPAAAAWSTSARWARCGILTRWSMRR